MIKLTPLLPLAALALAACGSQDAAPANETAGANATAEAAPPPLELPPSVVASRVFRCKDSSVVYVDFLSDEKSANLKTEKDGMPTRLTAPAAGETAVADGGYALKGTGTEVTLTLPGKPAQTCKA